MNDTQKVGIKQRIQQAKSLKEIDALLAKAKAFTKAHPSTLRKCEREAIKRAAELEGK